MKKTRPMRSVLLAVLLCMALCIAGGGLNYAYINARAEGEIQVPASSVSVVQYKFPEWGVCNAVKFEGQFPTTIQGYTGTFKAANDSFKAIAPKLLVNGVRFDQSSGFNGTKDQIWIWYNNSATEWYLMLYQWTPAEGTVLTVKEGLPLYNDQADNGTVFAVTTGTISYVFTSGAWTKVADPQSITFASTQDYLVVGDDLALEASYLPVGSAGENISFTSSDESVATVDADGVVHGVAAGEVTITATGNSLTAEYEFDVVESVTKTGLTVVTKTQNVEPYEDYALPQAKWTVTAGGKTYTGNPFTVAKNNVSGTFDNGKPGDNTLTVTIDGKSDTFTATVKEFTEIVWPEALPATAIRNSDIYFATENTFGSGNFNADGYCPDVTKVKVYRKGGIVGQASHVRIGGNTLQWYFQARNPIPAYDPKDGALEGDKIVVEKGFRFTVPDTSVTWASEGFAYVYSNGKWIEYVGEPTSITVTKPEGVGDTIYTNIPVQLGVTFAPEKTTGPITWMSSSDAVATVDQTGKVMPVGSGSVTITATCITADDEPKTLTSSVTFTAKEHGPLVGVTVVNPYPIYVAKGEEIEELPAKWSARPVYNPEGSTKLEGVEFELTLGENLILPETQPTDVVGKTQWDVTVKVPTGADTTGNQTGKLDVIVYEYYDQEISSVNVLDPATWGAGWGYGMLVALGNTSSNHADFTEGVDFDAMKEFISYKRADGTDVEYGFFGILSSHIGVRPTFADDPDISISNLDQYYKDGDVLTFKKGMPMYKKDGMIFVEGYLKEETVFVYRNATWNFFKDYEGITAAKTTLEIAIGKSMPSGVSKVPANASEGVITYISSDQTVATVTTSGLIRGLKAGTTTITATITDSNNPDRPAQEVSIEVTVVDEITGIVFEPETLTVKPGADLDLSGVKAYYVWASGTKGEQVDLSNASISGYDATVTAEQSVTVKVKVDGVEYSGKLKIVTGSEKKGCGCGSEMGVATTATLAGVILLLAAGLVLRRKGKAE